VRSYLHGLERNAGYHRIGLVIGYVNRWGDGGLNFLHLIFAFCAQIPVCRKLGQKGVLQSAKS